MAIESGQQLLHYRLIERIGRLAARSGNMRRYPGKTPPPSEMPHARCRRIWSPRCSSRITRAAAPLPSAMFSGRWHFRQSSLSCAPSSANFDALYAAMVGIAIMPPTELTLGAHLLLWVFPLVVVVVVVAQAIIESRHEREAS